MRSILRPTPVLACALAFAALFPTQSQGGPNDSVWIQLFDKTHASLSTNWDVKIRYSALNVDTRNTFRRTIAGSDTMLEISYSNYTSYLNGGSSTELFGHAGYKHRIFSYYLLRSEYTVFGTTRPASSPSWANQNNGFMLHSQSMATMGTNQDFPISLEAQLLGPGNNDAGGSGTGNSPGTMNLCTPGTAFRTTLNGSVNTAHCTPAMANTRAAVNAWQKVSALILGDSIHRYYAGTNGTTLVMTYYRPVQYSGSVSGNTVTIVNNTPITGGYIVIQSESHPYRFRTIEVLNLEGCMTPTNDVNYKSYLVKHNAAACGGTTGIRGVSPREGRIAAPMAVVGNAVKIDGTERVTLEAFDMSGARIGSYTAQAPFQWSPGVKKTGVHVIRAITPKGTYTERVTLF